VRFSALLRWIPFVILQFLAAEGGDTSTREDSKAEEVAWRELGSHTGPNENVLDLWHNRVSSAIANPVDRVDRFFGDERLKEENRRTRLNTGLGWQHDGKDGGSLWTDVSLRLALPQLEHRLQLFLDDWIKAEEGDPVESILGVAKDSEPDTGFRYIFHQDERRSLSTDIGARFSSPVQILGRLRARLTCPVGDWQLRLNQTLSFLTADGWTETSEMTWNRPMENDYLFRSTSRLVWEERQHGVTPKQAWILHKKIDEKTAGKVALSSAWPESFHTRKANHSVTFTCRRLMYRTWLFLEIAPGVEFPQVDHFNPNLFVRVKCEIVFCDDVHSGPDRVR